MRLQTFLSLGWSPQLANVVDGSRVVQQVVGWAGGTGTAPATGLYVGATGYVVLIADAVDIRGSAGSAGGSYEHTQNSASSTWTVNHGLGYKPGGVLVKDSANNTWLGSIDHINNNSLTISFGAASFTGVAYIS